jgi:signal peptidase II
MKFLATIGLPLYLLDQATKWATVLTARRGLLPHEVIPNYFTLDYWQNTGAAFSIGHGNNGFFIGLSFAAFIGLLIAWRRNVFPDRLSRWGVAILLPGILGNLTDRIVHGHVVDFLIFDLHVKFANPWPAFNVADSCICIAVGLFLISSFSPVKKTP